MAAPRGPSAVGVDFLTRPVKLRVFEGSSSHLRVSSALITTVLGARLYSVRSVTFNVRVYGGALGTVVRGRLRG